MKIVGIVHFAMPWRNAGSETVAQTLFKALVDAGHEVRLYVSDCPGERAEVFEGVQLVPVRNVMVACTEARKWKPDVWVSHHQNAAMSTRFARSTGGRSVFLTHNDMDVNMIPLKFQPDLVVHNSQWVMESLQRYRIDGQQMVMHPPLDCSRHEVYPPMERRTHVTLINVNEHKGARFLHKLAERMPDVQFAGVMGGHGVQLKAPRRLSNLTTVRHGPNLKPVWEMTRLLIMPSIYESYGLTGVEAGCSGIPTLANPTIGLRESQGPAGLFISWPSENLPQVKRPSDNIEWKQEWANPSPGHLNEWETAIRTLMEPEEWDRASVSARQRSVELCEKTDIDIGQFVTTVEGLPSIPQVPYTRTATRRTARPKTTTRR